MGHIMDNLIKCFAVGIFTIIASNSAIAECDEIYFKVGAGYKFEQTKYFVSENTGQINKIKFNDPLSARIETGVDCGKWSYGISHHSQWRTGFPFNNENEIQKTEFFIDYKLSWGI